MDTSIIRIKSWFALAMGRQATLPLLAAVLPAVLVICIGLVIVERDSQATPATNNRSASLPTGLTVSNEIILVGEVPANGSANANIIIENKGATEYALTGVTPECGCTVVDSSSKRLGPGKKLVIPVTFHAGSSSGSFLKGISVNLSDGSSVHELKFILSGAVVESRFTVFPASLEIHPKDFPDNVVLYVRGPSAILEQIPESIVIPEGELPALVPIQDRGRGVDVMDVKAIRLKLSNQSKGGGVLASSIIFRMNGTALVVPISVANQDQTPVQ